jgi:hypothetical protein
MIAPIAQPSFSLLSASPVNKQGQSVADSIAQANSEAAAKRKVMAEQRLEMLRKRLNILMLFSATDTKGNKGYASAAASIAREIAQAVRDYTDASGSDQTTSSQQSSTTDTVSPTTITLQGLSKEDQAFLSSAVQLSSQVKAIISAENQKARRRHVSEESYQGDINNMDDQINQSFKSLSQNIASSTTISINIAISSFAVSA